MPLIALSPHDRYDYVPLPERPDFTWPGGRRLSVCICNNIEVFSFLDGLGSDSAAVGAPQTARNFAWRDYGNRVGIWYLFEMLDELGVPAAHNLNALVPDACPQIVDRILARGDEVVAHGRTNAERQDVLDEAGERALIAETTERLRAFTGTAPAGWLGPWLAQTRVTPDLLREAGYRYMMDWPADDQPFWMRTRAGPLLSVPYSIEINDSPAMVFRQQSAEEFERMIVDQFDEMLHQSAKRPLVFTIVLHSFVIGQPYRLRALRRALSHVLADREALWIATPGQVAGHYAGLFPPPA